MFHQQCTYKIVGFDVVEKFVCPEKSGRFADPCNCQKFYNCGGGRAWPKICASGTYFDPEAKNCNWARKVNNTDHCIVKDSSIFGK